MRLSLLLNSIAYFTLFVNPITSNTYFSLKRFNTTLSTHTHHQLNKPNSMPTRSRSPFLRTLVSTTYMKLWRLCAMHKCAPLTDFSDLCKNTVAACACRLFIILSSLFREGAACTIQAWRQEHSIPGHPAAAYFSFTKCWVALPPLKFPYSSGLPPISRARDGACAVLVGGCVFFCGGRSDNELEARVAVFSFRSQV
jgi:hypothetical protein